ncbi:type II secretion system F family protein [Halomonas sp. MCCC 1A17488]|uniref:type II secretion system F family protein n=1 Tax=unclassified Halomonas TaxID=2609666 RepID=UPI0018D25C0F|nr:MULTISPECIES: type II secretion system F family protein [unclassified Halomonas]MCE8015757.1 type II secretion system F family protein [Halomonas sp. MCCC 1A17488]MCG3239090.1 type II secretion system F family protein [Halomonas sp. MCCC 1A17488]QPP50964.1 type II secretion system F family protein [Halomonas sp. SS10-MC5]
MERLMQWLQPLSDRFEDPESIQLVFASLLGLAIFALLIAVMFVVMGLSDPLRRRLRSLEASGASGTANAETGLREWLGPMGERLVPTEEEARSRIALELRRAGKRSPGAVNLFFGVRLLLTVVPPILLLLVVVPFVRLEPVVSVMLVAGSAIAGYLLPRFWLERAIKRRTRLLRRGLPDALDLLVVCSEAGLGLAAAIQRVARDLEISHPELAEELHLFGLQTRAGMDNKAALRDLEERTGVDDIRGLVTTLLQSMRFGTSIAMTLRLFAVELRDKRTQEAEEKAAKVSTKMLFPLIFCVFPSFFVVALGPPLLGAMAALAGR